LGKPFFLIIDNLRQRFEQLCIKHRYYSVQVYVPYCDPVRANSNCQRCVTQNVLLQTSGWQYIHISIQSCHNDKTYQFNHLTCHFRISMHTAPLKTHLFLRLTMTAPPQHWLSIKSNQFVGHHKCSQLPRYRNI
jgi:hypothetical protein